MRLQGKHKPLRDSPLDYKTKMHLITFPVYTYKYFYIMFSVEGNLLQNKNKIKSLKHLHCFCLSPVA